MSVRNQRAGGEGVSDFLWLLWRGVYEKSVGEFCSISLFGAAEAVDPPVMLEEDAR